MRIFAISDLHLSTSDDKPMEIFGSEWENHWENISKDWDNRVKEEDIVLIGGDTSWALKLENALKDLQLISERPGTKIIIRGNHDYWWSSPKKIRNELPDSIKILQNDAIKIGGYIFAGTRGWTVPDIYDNPSDEDIKLYAREELRLKMSLDSAKKLRTNNEKIIAIIHFPPFNSLFDNSNFTNLFKEYEVSKVVYGHLHGKHCRTKSIVYKDNIPYYLTSCDKLDFKLLEII